MKPRRPTRTHRRSNNRQFWGGFIATVVVAVVGLVTLRLTGAATFAVNKEAESGVLAGKIAATGSTGASGGSAVKFGGNMCGSPTVPMGPRNTFVGDFSTGNFSQWSGVQVQGYNGSGANFGGNSRAQIVAGCDGKPAVKSTVSPGDQVASGERAEVAMQRNGGLTHEGDERWYDFSVKFDNDFRWPTGAYFIIMQWHSSSGSPPLSIEVSNSGNLMVHNNRLQARKTVAPIIKGQWMNLVFHTKFSNNSSVGFVHMYVNGQERLAKTGFRTMADGENYLKMGIYRNGTVRDPTASVYNQGLRIMAP